MVQRHADTVPNIIKRLGLDRQRDYQRVRNCLTLMVSMGLVENRTGLDLFNLVGAGEVFYHEGGFVAWSNQKKETKDSQLKFHQSSIERNRKLMKYMPPTLAISFLMALLAFLDVIYRWFLKN